MALTQELQFSSRRRWTRPEYLRNVLFCAAVVIFTIGIQYRSGAYTSDFTRDMDEPAHVVSSLMVHDYLSQRFFSNPLAFAREFYAHYPKVAIGHWPPLFYCGEAIWMLAMGRSRLAMLLFVALCGSALAVSVYLELSRRTAYAVALAGTISLILSNTFQQMLSAVRPDLLLSLLGFWATVYCGKYLFLARRSDGIIFAFMTAIALLVHGRAGLLLFLPFCLLPFSQRAITLKWLVAGALLLLVLVVPQRIGQADAVTVHSLLTQGRLVFVRSLATMGWLTMLFAFIGLVQVFRPEKDQLFWAAMTALVIAGFLFNLFVPVVWSDYLLITVLPALAVLAGGGLQVVSDGIARIWPRAPRILGGMLALMAVVIAGRGVAREPRKPDLGYHRMIADCLLCSNRVTLIAAGSLDEGAFIAEGSLADPYRTHTIMRGSKVLSQSTWGGHNYRMVYSSPAQVIQFLNDQQISLVLVQSGEGVLPHIIQLRSAMAQDPTWGLGNEKTAVQGIQIYRRVELWNPVEPSKF